MSDQHVDVLNEWIDRLVRAAFDAGFTAAGDGYVENSDGYRAVKELEIARLLEETN